MIPVKGHAIIVVGIVAEGVEVAPGVTVTVCIDGRPSAQVAFEVPSEGGLRIRRNRAVAAFRQHPFEDHVVAFTTCGRIFLQAFEVVASRVDPVEADPFAFARGIDLLDGSGVGFAFHEVLHIMLEERVGRGAFEDTVEHHLIILEASALA